MFKFISKLIRKSTKVVSITHLKQKEKINELNYEISMVIIFINDILWYIITFK